MPRKLGDALENKNHAKGRDGCYPVYCGQTPWWTRKRLKPLIPFSLLKFSLDDSALNNGKRLTAQKQSIRNAISLTDKPAKARDSPANENWGGAT